MESAPARFGVARQTSASLSATTEAGVHAWANGGVPLGTMPPRIAEFGAAFSFWTRLCLGVAVRGVLSSPGRVHCSRFTSRGASGERPSAICAR